LRLRTLGLLVTLALGILAAPLAPGAQPRSKVPRIGILPSMVPPLKDAFLQGLRELGYVEGQTIAIEYRDEQRIERFPDVAAELVRLKVDVIVTYGVAATRAAKAATETIPIVMVGVGEPVRTGLVASLARPGGNITGSTVIGVELGAKRLQLLKEIVPHVARVAVLWNPANPAQPLHFESIQAGARALGVTLLSVEVRSPDEFEGAFAAMTRQRPDAFIMTGDFMHQEHSRWIVDFMAKSRLPAMYQLREHVEAGGLMGYGASFPELSRRAATYVDKILKGAKPADLPVEQPTKFELVVNLKTAKALGLTIPQSVLIRADEVIQ